MAIINHYDKEAEEIINRAFRRAVKEKYPQFNNSTHLCYTNKSQIDIQQKQLTEKYWRDSQLGHIKFRGELKESIQENMGCLINDRNFLIKIIDEYYESIKNKPIEKVIDLQPFYFDYFIDSRCTFISLIGYDPETDTLFINNSIMKYHGGYQNEKTN